MNVSFGLWIIRNDKYISLLDFKKKIFIFYSIIQRKKYSYLITNIFILYYSNNNILFCFGFCHDDFTQYNFTDIQFICIK
jgi:hypothetical protein